MDDDVDLDSECVYNFLLWYAKTDFAVSGGMLDLYKSIYCMKQEHCSKDSNNMNSRLVRSICKSNLDLQTVLLSTFYC